MLNILSAVAVISAICAIFALVLPSMRKRFEGKTALITWYIFLSLLLAFQLYAFGMSMSNDPEAWWIQAARYSTYGIAILAVIFVFLIAGLRKGNSENSK